MIHFKYKITSPIGMHARPAANIVNTAEKFESKITIGKDGTKLNGKSLMGMIALKAYEGDTLQIWIEGPDEVKCQAAMLRVFHDELSKEAYEKVQKVTGQKK